MYATIIDAMNELGDSGLVFGLENSQKGEDEFQLALGKKLEHLTGSDGWSWHYWRRNEERFETEALANEKTIKIDIVGRHPANGMVAIELKYVTSGHSGRSPSNPPAFPYDIAKDCLRLDLLRAGECKPIGEPIPDDLQTYAIGLTDWPDYWQSNKPKHGWAANFYSAIRSSPVHFQGLIRTLGSDSENTIALGRCHIAFGRPWTGQWFTYGTSEQTKRFRYLILRPEHQAKAEWQHHQGGTTGDQTAIFPFLDRHSREGWFKRNSLKKQKARSKLGAMVKEA